MKHVFMNHADKKKGWESNFSDAPKIAALGTVVPSQLSSSPGDEMELKRSQPQSQPQYSKWGKGTTNVPAALGTITVSSSPSLPTENVTSVISEREEDASTLSSVPTTEPVQKRKPRSLSSSGKGRSLPRAPTEKLKELEVEAGTNNDSIQSVDKETENEAETKDEDEGDVFESQKQDENIQEVEDVENGEEQQQQEADDSDDEDYVNMLASMKSILLQNENSGMCVNFFRWRCLERGKYANPLLCVHYGV
eukprot:m.55420 g.55420  ORF g.55420 m.55420 type:complete len:251 (+) comp11123_c1_seq8:59-811(+)